MATGGPLQMENIFQLLESPDTVKDIKEIILDNLNSSRETWLIHLLVDYYFRTQSSNVQDILAELRDIHAKTLFDKLQDGIKTPETRLSGLQLVLYFAYRELPWCQKLVEMPIFSSILKCLRSEYDVPILMTATMIVVILLPSVPIVMGQYLPQIFESFGRLCVFCLRRPANTPEVFILHLQVALYSLFHRLYGMYPCSFMAYISKFGTQKENIHVYEEVILPMLERVRLHPKLVTGHKDSEVLAKSWMNHETQDIVVACSKMSLDLIEGSWEDSQCPIFHSLQFVDKCRLEKPNINSQDILKAIAPSQLTELSPQESLVTSFPSTGLLVPAFDVTSVGESPSVLIGLSTPPSSQRATPAITHQEQGSAGDSAESISRQHTPSQTEDGEKTPLSGRVFQFPKTPDSKKWSSAPSPKLSSHPTPTTPGGQHSGSATPGSTTVAETTPLKSQASAFASPSLSRSNAVRSIQFDSAIAERDKVEGSVQSTLKTDQNKAKRESPMAKLCEELKVESARVETARVEPARVEPARVEPARVEPAKVESVNKTASVEPMKVDPSHPESLSSPVHVEGLPLVISSLNSQDTEHLDQEVQEINDHFDDEVSPSPSVTTLAPSTEITAESVKQFMKKVNRIRFNSLTSNSSSSDLDNVSMTSQVHPLTIRRPRSCPPFKRLSLATQTDTPPQSGRKPRKYYSGGGEVAVSQNVWKRSFQKQKSHVESMGESPGECAEREMNQREMIQREEDSSDDMSSYTGSHKETPKRSCPAKQEVETPEDVIPTLPAPLSSVFQYIVAPAKLSVCSSCHQQLVVQPGLAGRKAITDSNGTTIRASDVSLFSMLSPPELLDRHLRLGSDIHAKELTKIPLTSKETTNWTHFGGMPPADEVNILRGQILLMQNQLMYERHKRTNHAKRNRRLLRKIAHVSALEEQQKSLINQSKLNDQEIFQLKQCIQRLQENNRTLKQSQESDEYEKLVQFRTSLQENKDLKASNVALKNLLLTQREDYDKLQKKLEHVQHVNMENEKELRISKERLSNTEKLKEQVFKLQKEVLLMQELHQKCQEKIHLQNGQMGVKGEQSYLISSLKAEMADLKSENKKKTSLLEAYQTRMIELEEQVKAKETAITELKRNFEISKNSHDEQLKAVEERCVSMVHINQQLEARVMELLGQLDQSQHWKTLRALKDTRCGSSSPSVPVDSGNEVGSSLEHGLKRSSSDCKVEVGGEGDTDGKEEGREVATKGREITASGSKASLVVAKDEVSVASSTFTNSSMGARSSRFPSVSTRDSDIMSDSGATSRSSFRVDSDASMKSVSTHSLTTGDSGCWPKVE